MTDVGDVMLVPDLPIEGWRSMDRYAAALAQRLPGAWLAPEAGQVRGPRYWARYVAYPRALRRHRPPLVHVLDHSYGHCLRVFPRARTVVTVHDLWPVRVQRRHEPGPRAWLRDRLLRRAMAAAGAADRVIAVSAAVADEAASALGIARARITVIENGVDATWFAPATSGTHGTLRAGWQHRSGGSDLPILLHVGSCEERKNVEALLHAAAALRRRGRDCLVVQIGGRFSARQQSLLRSLRLGDRVLQEPAVTDETLREAYRAADLLVLPSIYEGFGLPVLEAMASGLPVLTSGAGGLREAGGEAAAVADPADAAAFADAIGGLLDDRDGLERMRSAGLAHARRHSWDRTAEAVREVYAALLS